jgi:acyl transferase domain-containing protein
MIAVIGVSCRLPQAQSASAYWDLIRTGRSAIGEAPPARGLAAWRGGFLESVDAFDAGFFGISPREATHLDPQQRLVLELGWEATEDAQVPADQLRGTRTGVFIGAMSGDYAAITSARPAGPHTLGGVTRSMLANRLSHFLGLRGPSLVIDSGQSSSLVAVHLACESMRRGECEMAIAGGVQLNLAESGFAAARELGALSPDGRCHPFDSRANGYVRGEGGALVLLKPLHQALAEGDRVHWVLLGGAVATGTGGGLTVPDRAAQEWVLRQAYE